VAHRTYHNDLSQMRNHMLPGTRQEEALSAHTGGCGGPLPFHDCFRVFIHNRPLRPRCPPESPRQAVIRELIPSNVPEGLACQA
jgi:hypothetical protein